MSAGHGIEAQEAATYDEDDSGQVPPGDIVAYNELRSCADLVRMVNQEVLDLNPEFQRELVWPGPMQTRFIDSLMKQLPIPSMCFAYDNKKTKWMVIDGLQRLHTIRRFLSGADWRLSVLDDVDTLIAGKAAAAFRENGTALHSVFTRIENLTIPITVLRCDFDKASHMGYLFMIFHRLNTGGMHLNNQEIRNCIYLGTLNGLLKELDADGDWRKMNRMAGNKTYRFVKQELILRLFAFHDDLGQYNGHLAKFLNDYMHRHRNAQAGVLDAKRSLFKRTVSILYRKAMQGDAPKKLSLTLLEAALVGVSSNIDQLEAETEATVQGKWAALMAHASFSEESIGQGLSKKPRVLERMRAAIDTFGR